MLELNLNEKQTDGGGSGAKLGLISGSGRSGRLRQLGAESDGHLKHRRCALSPCESSTSGSATIQTGREETGAFHSFTLIMYFTVLEIVHLVIQNLICLTVQALTDRM